MYTFKYLLSVNKKLLLLLSVVGLGFAGCDILEVDNPNSLVEEDLENPASASSIANGAEATLTGAIGELLGPYSTATDELQWIGTRDAWEQLDQGEVDDPLNEFADNAFTEIAEARWTADEAVRRLEAFREEGTLQDRQALIRSYAYAAASYLAIADAFDDFVFSDRQEAASAIGEDNKGQIYSSAIEYLDSGLNLAEAGSEWEARLLALRARASFSEALWERHHPDTDTADPLVESGQAAQDAQAALDAIDTGSDWSFILEVTSETPNNGMAFQVNERLELRIGDAYVEPTADGSKAESVTLEDPIGDVPAPYLVNYIDAFVEANQYADVTLASERELYLIIAEDALARNDEPAFEEAINALRALDGLSEYDGQVSARELLEHSRQVNLFLQGRRLADQYRFDVSSPEWRSNRITPGAFFPITISEIRANPNISLD